MKTVSNEDTNEITPSLYFKLSISVQVCISHAIPYGYLRRIYDGNNYISSFLFLFLFFLLKGLSSACKNWPQYSVDMYSMRHLNKFLPLFKRSIQSRLVTAMLFCLVQNAKEDWGDADRTFSYSCCL